MRRALIVTCSLALLAVGSYPSPAADGRVWKYCTSALPSESVNDCPMSDEPTTCPLRVRVEPFARWSRPGTCAISVITSGYATPKITVNTIRMRSAATC